MMRTFLLYCLIFISSVLYSLDVDIVYVSSDGDGFGISSDAPTDDIQQAIDTAIAYDASEIRVSGDFVLEDMAESDGYLFINTDNLKITGGWDSTFTSQEGESEISYDGDYNRLLFMTDCNDVEISGFLFIGGDVSENGGGVYIDNCDNMVLGFSCSNCNAGDNGGGLFIEYSDSISITGNYYDCYAYSEGGGVYCDSIYSLYIDGTYLNNSSDSDGGAISLSWSEFGYVTGIFSDNSTEHNGGAIECYDVSDFDFYGVYSNNIAGDGSSIYLSSAEDCTIYGTHIGEGRDSHKIHISDGYCKNCVISDDVVYVEVVPQQETGVERNNSINSGGEERPSGPSSGGLSPAGGGRRGGRR